MLERAAAVLSSGQEGITASRPRIANKHVRTLPLHLRHNIKNTTMATPYISPKTSTEDIDVEISPKAARVDSVPRNKFEYDLTTMEGVRSFLYEQTGESKKFELQALTGGTANHVYRMTDRAEGRKGQTRIWKHAAPGLASNPRFRLDPARMDFEAQVLLGLDREFECPFNTAECLRECLIDGTHVHTVYRGYYERDIKLLCLEDAGRQNLKEAYLDLSKDQVEVIGAELGKWLAKLHGRTPRSIITEAAEHPDINNNTGMQIAGFTYKNLPGTLGSSDPDQELADTIAKHFDGLIGDDKECVCHGDFWPGNIMVRGREGGAGHVLTVIDWELVRIGNGATDVGQFAAEAFLLDRYHGNKGLRAAFIRAYLQSSAVNFGSKELIYPWMTRVAVHFAAHLAVWPTRGVHWASKEDTTALSGLARAILKDAVSATPDLRIWRVFDGLQNLDQIAAEMMVKRGDPFKRKTEDNKTDAQPEATL